jgi:hypothetical protein
VSREADRIPFISFLPGMPGRCNRNASVSFTTMPILKNFHAMFGRRVFDTPRDGK